MNKQEVVEKIKKRSQKMLKRFFCKHKFNDTQPYYICTFGQFGIVNFELRKTTKCEYCGKQKDMFIIKTSIYEADSYLRMLKSLGYISIEELNVRKEYKK